MADVEVRRGKVVPPEDQCRACPREATYRVTVTHASGEQTKAKLCIPHAQLVHDYKHDWTPSDKRIDGRPNIEIREGAKAEFLETVEKDGGRELGERLCDRDRRMFVGPRIIPPREIDPPGY